MDQKFGVHNTTEEKHKVTIFGDIELDSDERALLTKRPEFALYENICSKRLSEEMTITQTKIRRDRMSCGCSMEEEEDKLSQSEEEMKADQDREEQLRLEEGQSRLVFDPETTSIDMGAKRAEEAVLQARQGVWTAAARDYTSTHFCMDGTQKVHNLNTVERVGLA